jgi:raffinose/stachyose/melibiose transport system permease protein
MSKIIRKALLGVFIGIVLLIYGYPIVWMYVSSMRTTGNLISHPLAFPEKLHWSNFVTAFNMANLGHHFIVSVLLTTTSVAIVIIFSTLAAFSFSRLRYRGKNILFSLFFLGLILPVHGFLVGLFIQFRTLHLLNTFWAFILPVSGINLSLAILLIKTYMDGIPTSLEEVAYLEGAKSYQVLWHVILPISVPILATVITFTAISVWNEFLIPFVMIQSTKIKPLTTSLYVFSTRHSAKISLKLAALAMIATPMFIMYIFFQNQIQKGITAGALKE